MQSISSLVTTDSRTPIQKLRRPALQKIARNNGIKFDPSGPATSLVKLIEGSGVDVLKEGNFQRLLVQDEKGRTSEVFDPIVKPHATANSNINYDAILEANAKANEKEDENAELRDQVAKLTALVEGLKPQEMSPDVKKPQKMHEIRAECKRLGIKTSPTDKKIDLIEKLNGKNSA